MYVVSVYVSVMWMYGVCTYVFVCSVFVCGVDVWCLYVCECVCVGECVCMCQKVAGIFTCYSDSATEAPESTASNPGRAKPVNSHSQIIY